MGRLVVERDLGNRIAGLRYWVAGSDVNKYPGDRAVTLDDELSPFALSIMFLLCFMV